MKAKKKDIEKVQQKLRGHLEGILTSVGQLIELSASGYAAGLASGKLRGGKRKEIEREILELVVEFGEALNDLEELQPAAPLATASI